MRCGHYWLISIVVLVLLITLQFGSFFNSGCNGKHNTCSSSPVRWGPAVCNNWRRKEEGWGAGSAALPYDILIMIITRKNKKKTKEKGNREEEKHKRLWWSRNSWCIGLCCLVDSIITKLLWNWQGSKIKRKIDFIYIYIYFLLNENRILKYGSWDQSL